MIQSYCSNFLLHETHVNIMFLHKKMASLTYIQVHYVGLVHDLCAMSVVRASPPHTIKQPFSLNLAADCTNPAPLQY
jgi:hypothetical protein